MVAWLYLSTPAGCLFDTVTSVPLSFVEYSYLQVSPSLPPSLPPFLPPSLVCHAITRVSRVCQITSAPLSFVEYSYLQA